MSLGIGAIAPDFKLKNQYGEEVRLSQYEGTRNVALVFFPLAFSGICTGELCEIRDNIHLFRDASVELIGISVDSHFALRAWSEKEKYGFQLVADFWPHGQTAKDYGVFVENAGIANRATFLINKERYIAEVIITEPGQARDFGAYREALSKLT